MRTRAWPNGAKPGRTLPQFVESCGCSHYSRCPAKCALIAGITGQDGSYLEEWLLAQGYEVQPGGCYYLAAQSFVSYSFDDEFSSLNT